MRIRQFSGPTTAAALRALRDALGAEALVLSTEIGPDGSVVVTAAADGEPTGDAPQAPAAQGGTAADEALRSDVALIRIQLEQLGRRMHRIDRVLRELDGVPSALGPDGRDVADRLVASGFGRHLAEPVGEAFEREVGVAPSRDAALAASLLAHVAIVPPPAARVTAFVGPTGSGKTTTIAKLAASAVRDGRAAPTLVAADTRRIGAVQELEAYARLLGAPLVVAHDARELSTALATLGEGTQAYVDTAGLCGDAACGAEVHELVAAAGAAVSVVAVLSAAASLRSLHAAWPQIARLRPQSCAVTKLDECDEPGAACTFLADAGLPLCWLGTGRRVPDDLLTPSGEHLVRWLLAA